jgi:hypothetical protein
LNINTTLVTRFIFFDLLLFCILLILWFSVFNLTTHIEAICFFNVLQMFDKMLVWNNSFFRYWCSSSWSGNELGTADGFRMHDQLAEIGKWTRHCCPRPVNWNWYWCRRLLEKFRHWLLI